MRETLKNLYKIIISTFQTLEHKALKIFTCQSIQSLAEYFEHKHIKIKQAVTCLITGCLKDIARC